MDEEEKVLGFVGLAIIVVFLSILGFNLLFMTKNWNNPCYWYTKCIQITGDQKDVKMVTAIINKDEK